ncbi:hypothetical protein H5999_04005 [[Clostridium] spiroforme]|nr:hypothetical protein [Thomasclavelia spiroformis]
MKHIFILKPDTDQKLIQSIMTLMQGRDYQFRYTRDIEDAARIAESYRQLNDHYRLYAVGGDGFVHKVVAGMIHSPHELVVIPAGTGNDLARSLYPDMDPMKILERSLTKPSRLVDVIRCNDNIYCMNVFCCGLDAEVGNMVNLKRDTMQWIPKSFHYSYMILKKLCHLQFYPTVIEIKDRPLFSGDVVICAFCNGRFFGGGVFIGYQSKLDDGLIDINVVSGISKTHLLLYLKALLISKLDHKDHYVHWQESAVTVKTSQYVNIDGEVYELGIYHLQCLHQVLKLVY